MHPVLLLVSLCLFPLLHGCAALPPRPTPPTIDDLVAMSQAGETPDALLAKLEGSPSHYELRGSEFATLAERGLPPAVLDRLLERQLAHTARRARWHSGPAFIGAPFRYYGDPWLAPFPYRGLPGFYFSPTPFCW